MIPMEAAARSTPTSPLDQCGTVQDLSQFPDEDPNPVLRVSHDGILLYANNSSWVLLAHWRTQVGSAVPPEWLAVVRGAIGGGEVLEREISVGFMTLLISIVPFPEKGYINLYGLDMTRRRQVEDKLRLNAQVFEGVAEGIMIMDSDRRILDVNRAFCAITGCARDEMLGEVAPALSEGREGRETVRAIWETVNTQGSWQGEVWERRRNGEPYPQWLSVSAIRSEAGEVTGYIGLFSDITAMKEAEHRLYRMAHYDALTGLCNRRHFQDILERSLKTARRTGEILSILFIDLDTFKLVNDSLGHAAGDALLCAVAERIRGNVRESDTVARMGGDEFTVLLPNLNHAANAGSIARKILAGIAEPVVLEGREVLVTASIGISLFPRDEADAGGLLQCADTAMYHAKEHGRNASRFFSREMSRYEAERLELQTRIHHALEEGQFRADYQPQVDIATGRITALEALARWDSPGSGILAPAAFIPVAEQSGQISEIGAQVLRLVCRQGARWRARGLLAGRLGVNVSMHQLQRADFIPLVQSVLAETGFPAGQLELELTESMLIGDQQDTLRKLERLKAIGVSLAIDDFGTKYSAFSYLRSLPVSRLKIDRSFVGELAGHGAGKEIAAAIISIGRSLKLDVVAEGVESVDQLRALRTLGCPCAQGYFLGRPAAPQLVEALLVRGCIARVSREGAEE
jgi:diguanylate cyclase (GGDEF)-like protein/PAS domain S-box-containing protein